ATRYVLDKFSKENDFYRNASLQSFAKRELAPAFSEASGVLVVATILIYGGSLILTGGTAADGLKASEFIAFIAILSQAIRPATAIVVALADIQGGQASGERILEVIDKPVEVAEKPDAIETTPFSDKLEFQQVSFTYGEK